MLTFEQILTIVRDSCRQAQPSVDLNAAPHAVILDKGDLLDVSRNLQQNSATYFDMLSCITGIDNGTAAATMEIAYNLYSIPYNHHLMIKVILPREKPEIESVCHLWKTANWHEREIFDLYGIQFLHHPDLRRILLPADWEGHPLRKDYNHQEYYRDIKVEY